MSMQLQGRVWRLQNTATKIIMTASANNSGQSGNSVWAQNQNQNAQMSSSSSISKSSFENKNSNKTWKNAEKSSESSWK